MGVADELARHNADLAKYQREKSRHAKSCRLCRDAKKLAEIEQQVKAGKLVKG